MADEELDVEAGEGEGEEQEGEKKKSPMKLIIILVVAIAVLGGGGFFAWKFFLAEPEKPPVAEEEKAAAEGGGEQKAKEDESKPGAILSLEPFIVNLADAEGKRYLKLSLAVDARNEELKKEVEDRMPRIRDSILLLLTSKSYADIATMAGKIRLRNEVLQIINRALAGKGSVHAVYFTEFVVQ